MYFSTRAGLRKKEKCVFMCTSLLGFGDELVGLIPVLQQVGGLLVVHSDVMVLKHPWEEVVYLSGHIQDVAHSNITDRKEQVDSLTF